MGDAPLIYVVTDIDADGPTPGWLGHHNHTHRAIDDAHGYASLLAHLMQLALRK